MRRGHRTIGQRREYRRMIRLLRELDRTDAGLPTRGTGVRKFLQKLLAIGAFTILVAAFVLVLANRFWGVALTGNGFHVPHRLGKAPSVNGQLGSFAFEQTQR